MLRRNRVRALGTEHMELFPVVAARHGAGTARALLGGFLRLPYHCVLALSAYATKMGRSLVLAEAGSESLDTFAQS